MSKCLIAGLPSAGKSTYIGALAYMLQKPINGQTLILSENPDDLSYLNKLTDRWLSLQIMERTTRGFANNIDLQLIRKTDNKAFSVSFPDIAGEDYESVVRMNSDVIANWSDKPDSLLLFINQWDNTILKEELEDVETIDINTEPSGFELKDISSVVQNVLILKELHLIFPWKKLAIGLSSWDKYQESYSSPTTLLKSRAPFLYNFIMHYFPDTYIFGVSAQGGEYTNDDETLNELIERTEDGTRAYIVKDDGTKSYDLTIPLNYLISD